MSILYLACLLAICLPILSVQLPRLFPTFFTRSKHIAENRSAIHQRASTVRRRVRPHRPTSMPRSEEQPRGRKRATDGADSGATDSEELHIQPGSAISTGLLARRGTVRGKPWDPPFARRDLDEGEKGKGKEVMRKSSPKRRTGRDLEAKGVAKRLFPPDEDGDAHGQYEVQHVEPQPEPEPEPEDIPLSTCQPVPAKKRKKQKSSAMSVIGPILAILGVLLFILAFAILIAHCLAWFLVYKTEARLGEARRGIMQGGGMRLCLCAT